MNVVHQGMRNVHTHGVFCVSSLLVLLITFVAAPALAYPEFQKYSQTNSGMGVSCAMCHANPDGPEGTGPGQVGRLGQEQLKLLNEARAAFEPGKDVHSPILNPFGNSIIKTIGKKKVVELKRNPKELASVLGSESDMDDDGASDAREYMDGTHPLRKSSGNPWLLAVHNFRKHTFNVVMVVLAVLCLLYGFHNLHMALERRYLAKHREGEELEPLEELDEDERPALVRKRRRWRVMSAPLGDEKAPAVSPLATVAAEIPIGK